MATTLDPIFTGMANGPETIDKNFQALNLGFNPEYGQTKLINAPDFNEITTPGIYYVKKLDEGGKNYPVASWGRLEVFYGDDPNNGSRLIQNYYCDDTNVLWSRRFYNNYWRPWGKFTTEDSYSADGANGYGTWYGEVHYRRVGRVCTASYNLKGGSNPSSGDMVSVPDWAVPLDDSVYVAGETADANVTNMMFANARIDGPSKKLVTSWIAGNIFIASITYVCA